MCTCAGGQYVFINIPAISWAEFHPFRSAAGPASHGVPACIIRRQLHGNGQELRRN